MPPYGSICANMTSYIKPEVYFVSQRCQKRIAPRPCTKIGEDRACSFGDMLADRHTDRHTDLRTAVIDLTFTFHSYQVNNQLNKMQVSLLADTQLKYMRLNMS